MYLKRLSIITGLDYYIGLLIDLLTSQNFYKLPMHLWAETTIFAKSKGQSIPEAIRRHIRFHKSIDCGSTIRYNFKFFLNY